MTSSKPSPLTSPAEDSDRPASSPAVTPEILKPFDPFRVEGSKLAAKAEVLPKIT